MNANLVLSNQLQALIDCFVDEQANVRNGLLFVNGADFKWKGASGLADPDAGITMLADDQFNIDSIAKMMTATMVMKLVEDGELRLRDRIERYLSDSIMQGLHIYEGHSYGNEITIGHLLNHTSGIRDDWALPGFFELIVTDTQRRWSPEETVEFVKLHSLPAFPPGDGFQYSDPGYNLLGLIIEEITGAELHEIYREYLLDPLGMNHTYRPSHEEARPSIPRRLPSFRYLSHLVRRFRQSSLCYPLFTTSEYASRNRICQAPNGRS